ncbi:hypothetical protein TorRG33x02_237200 [Trema orientale]|uniref:Uncharacterized protein n=1 Tax=Trema orientale TaxID=63057 RepID=A0A2P5E027_TREOI|nr:hypothetical protein TorRG33x02_237200 [Trema orientale]
MLVIITNFWYILVFQGGQQYYRRLQYARYSLKLAFDVWRGFEWHLQSYLDFLLPPSCILEAFYIFGLLALVFGLLISGSGFVWSFNVIDMLLEDVSRLSLQPSFLEYIKANLLFLSNNLRVIFC